MEKNLWMRSPYSTNPLGKSLYGLGGNLDQRDDEFYCPVKIIHRPVSREDNLFFLECLYDYYVTSIFLKL